MMQHRVLKGLPRALLAFGAGAVLTAAFAPFGQWLAVFPALAALLWLVLTAKSGWRAAGLGWLFAVGHHATALGWIANALQLDVDKYAVLVPMAKLGIPAYLGIFLGLACAGVWRLRRHPVAAWLVFAVMWLVVEYARMLLFLPFPWNLLGTVWSQVDLMAQVAAFIGVPGLGLLTALVASCPAIALRRGTGHRWAVWGSAGLAGMLVLAGAFRLVTAGAGQTDTFVRLVQPNIAQSLKWERTAADRNFHTLLSLTRTPAARPIAAVIWPESASPWPLDRDPLRRLLAVDSLPGDAVLLTGMNRWQDEAPDRPAQIWTSLFAFDRAGDILGFYDKHRLVPFGEYVPLRWLFNVNRVVQVQNIDFSPGTGTATLLTGQGVPPYSPLICYETIFPGEVALTGVQRPQWLLNITNDAWFGISQGPFQHLEMARMRAIEEGLPLVRVANTGISAVIDPWGRSLVQTALDEQRVVDIALPEPVAPPPFARYGHWVPGGLAVLCLLLAGVAYRKPRHAENAASPLPAVSG